MATVSKKYIKKLHFTETRMHDEVYEKQYGKPWILYKLTLALFYEVVYKNGGYSLNKVKIELDWDEASEVMSLIKWNPDEGDILGRIDGISYKEAKALIKFYK